MRSGRQPLLAAFVFCLLLGCTGKIVGSGDHGHGGGGSSGGGSGGTGGVCDPNAYKTVELASIATSFENDVYPLMMASNGGCVACHAPGMGREFTVYPADPEVTFYDNWSHHYFDVKPGSIVDRLTTTDPMTAMPKGGPAWTQEQIDHVNQVVCELTGFALGGGPNADEIFPPSLLHPYTGPAITDYDDSFINYPQLKTKVKAVFNDDWVRNGTDEFATNIGLFGGVDFTTHFVEARVATPEFLLGLDALAPDVCLQAATNKAGPFTGFSYSTPVIDQPASTSTAFNAVQSGVTVTPATGAGNVTGTASYFFYTNGSLATPVDINFSGNYDVSVKVIGDPDDGGNGPKIRIKLGSQQQDIVVSGTTQQTITAHFTGLPVEKMTPLSLAYINDSSDPAIAGGDRNVTINSFTIAGPTGTSTGTAHHDAAQANIDLLYQRMLYRHATQAEKDDAYSLLSDLEDLDNTQDAYQGLCESLVRHPDFLFTLEPAIDTTTGADHDQIMLVKLALDLLGRPPTAQELSDLKGGKTYEQFVDGYLTSPDFQGYYFNRAQLRTESQATPDTDEPARLWTYLALNDRPMHELLDGDYSVDATLKQVTRPDYYGKSGILSMKGFIDTKQGLPHYNYAARVFTDLMGYLFEIPPEVFAMRAMATAATTVDPTSICFNCHQNLTPLSYQRRRWDDTGAYHETDANNQPIDDTDDDMVPTYPYKGHGLEAFATQAVKKESFVRQTINSQYDLLMGRNMRWDTDERDVYKSLWDVSHGAGTFKAVLKQIAMSNKYRR